VPIVEQARFLLADIPDAYDSCSAIKSWNNMLNLAIRNQHELGLQ
jgi:hypothetical protein